METRSRNDVNKNRLAILPLRALYIRVSAAAIFTTGTMAIGFILCIILALLFNFKSSVATHCRVPNFLPSISAAIALPPSCYVWRLSVILTTVQRLIATEYHHMQYARVQTSRAWYPVLCNACALAELLENLSLIALTCISSTENTAYTIFSFFEYIVVLTNILYHGFVTYDFADVVIKISLPSKTD